MAQQHGESIISAVPYLSSTRRGTAYYTLLLIVKFKYNVDEADAGVGKEEETEEWGTIMQIKVSTGGIVVVVPPEIERTATLPLPLTAFDKLSVARTRKRLS